MKHVTFILVTSGLLQKESLELEKYRVLDRLEMISVLLMEELVLLSTGIPLTFCSVH